MSNYEWYFCGIITGLVTGFIIAGVVHAWRDN